jgi:hypothetical protein
VGLVGFENMAEFQEQQPPPEDPDYTGGPTPSETTNRLIARCLAAAAGDLDAEGLRQVLTRCTLELSAAKGAFATQVGEEPGLLDALPEEIEVVLDAFDAYGEVLAGACSWLTQPDPAILSGAAESLAVAFLDLNDALLAYEWAYLGYGDEPHAALNLMQKVLAALHQGKMEDARFVDILDRLWEHFEQGVEVFEKDSDPGRSIRGVRACREAMEGIQVMDGYLVAHDFNLLELGFVQFRQGCLRMVEEIQDSTGEALVQSPTPSPQVNWVIHAALAVLDGLAPDLLQRAQAWFESQLSESYFRFEQCATAALRGPIRVAEQVPVAREGFDCLNRALPLLRMGIQVHELLIKAIENLEQGAGLLYEAWMILNLYEEEHTSVFCPRCGSSNHQTQSSCASCGAQLVRRGEQAVAVPGLVASNVSVHLQRLLDACEATGMGRMAPEEFSRILSWASQILNEADLGMTRLPPEGSLEPEAAEALRELRQGIAEFRTALEELGRFIQDGLPVHVTNGTHMLIRACDRLMEVQARGMGG